MRLKMIVSTKLSQSLKGGGTNDGGYVWVG